MDSPFKSYIDLTQNHLLCGDNLTELDKIPNESVDLCYIDPPFFSNANYEVVWGNSYEMRAFGDRFEGGVNHYTDWMKSRLWLIHEKLKPTGTLYLHCDWHASHYLKVACDGIFGYKNFLNEIVWCYTRMSAKNQQVLSRAHDVILWYKKENNYTFNVDKARFPYSKSSKQREGQTLNRLGSGYSKEGKTVLNPNGKFPEDWFQLPYLRGKECIGYRTQKPEALLKRIIEVSSNPGDVVLDCFCGGGTTAKVCADLDRRFCAIDISPVAIRVTAARLNEEVPKVDFQTQGIPRTEAEWRALDGHAFAEWVCKCKGWTVNPKKSGDGGIDGWAYDNKKNQIPVQIKNHNKPAGRPDLQRFLGAIQREHNKGIFVAWEFSKEAIEYIAQEKESCAIEAMECLGLFEDLLISDDEQKKLEKLFKEKSKDQYRLSI